MTNNQLTDKRLTQLAKRNFCQTRGEEYVSFADEVVSMASELQEHRKAAAEQISFDALNAAVAEVTGGNRHAWDAGFYKGHQAVPFINYNSLSRIVEKFRSAQQLLNDAERAELQEYRKADAELKAARDSLLKPVKITCERCGRTTTHPDGWHYCHGGRNVK